ncbi:substrate-binding periplasmic protein [Silvanigrella aquatica]|uniref:Solute-binding protein family 3/N-terminal domain-containing protein n=1 Tax=Silvanigrella aquatica TaxID=1915309 RepID=A0A1L4D0Z0_9BACT|nr:transporter substrate-binding domain-containing protein [Silvanigrella aquatica]APJ03857.1 hypothetical protein AXG55_08035 [Silvanigrella aquatica]
MKYAILILILLSFNSYAKEMKVCFEDFLPSAGMKGDKPIGIDVEIISAAMKTQNVKIKFIMLPWNRCIYELDKKSIDAIIPMVYSQERDEKYSLGTSMRTRGNILIRNPKTKEINSLQDMSGLKVGSAKGYVISKEYTEATNFTKVDITSSDEVAAKILKEIANGSVDCGIVDMDSAYILIKKLQLEKKVIISNFKLKKASHVGFVKNSPYLNLYEKGFKIISDNGQIKRIIDKYYHNK